MRLVCGPHNRRLSRGWRLERLPDRRYAVRPPNPPGQYTPREVAEDVVVGGTTIPEGSRVILLRGSANRDARRFADPDTFDLRRPNSADHVGFGEGPTVCIGAGLARIELQVAIGQLLERVTPVRITRWVQRPSKLIWGPSRVDLEYA